MIKSNSAGRLRPRTAAGTAAVGALGLGVGAALLVGGPMAGATPAESRNPSCPAGTSSLKLDPVEAGTYTSGDSSFSVTVDGLQPDEDGEYRSFDFAVTDGTALVVIVKGGPSANTFDYRPAGTLAGADLRAPINRGGNRAAISHITFCYGEVASPSPSPSQSPSGSPSPSGVPSASVTPPPSPR